MVFGWLPPVVGAPLIDLAGGERQIFQGPVPDISYRFQDKSAQILVAPNDIKHWSKEYAQMIEEVSSHFTVLVFNRGDFPKKIKGNKVISIQNSIIGKQNKNTIIIPYNIQDFQFRKLREEAPPSISFVGYVPKSYLGRTLKTFPRSIIQPIQSNGALVRRIGLYYIKRSGLNYQVIERDYYGGAASLITDPKMFRAEYLESLVCSPYIFAPRGDANSSQRFFEALSIGRIPVVPKTSMVAPLVINREFSLRYIRVKTTSRDIFAKVNKHWNKTDSAALNSLLRENSKFFQANWNYTKFINFLFSTPDPDWLTKLSLQFTPI